MDRSLSARKTNCKSSWYVEEQCAANISYYELPSRKCNASLTSRQCQPLNTIHRDGQSKRSPFEYMPQQTTGAAAHYRIPK